MKKLLLLFIIISVFGYGQKTEKIKGFYNLKLIGELQNIEGSVISPDRNSYEDSLIAINFNYSTSQIGFYLQNKSKKSIKIDWNNASIVDQNKNSHKVFHKGIKYIDREKEQQPTTIYKESNLSDLVSSIDNVYYTSGKYGGWQEKPLIRYQTSFWGDQVYDESLIGKKTLVAIPISLESKVIEYLFEFETVFNKKIK